MIAMFYDNEFVLCVTVLFVDNTFVFLEKIMKMMIKG